LLPFAKHDLTWTRVALVQHLHRAHAVRAEVAIVFARLAEADEDSAFWKVADRKWPDYALCLAVPLVAIAERQLVLAADGVAQVREIFGRELSRHRRSDSQRHRTGAVPHCLGQDFFYLGERTGGRHCERLVAEARHPAHAQHQRFGFSLREHHRWQKEARAQHVADPRLAADLCALRAQRRDVAIQRGMSDFNKTFCARAARSRAWHTSMMKN
jgi:hypothetical protein